MKGNFFAGSFESAKIGPLKWISAIVLVNFTVAAFATQIFSTGFPLGMDTFSHLPKIFYLAKFGVASWYFDWYGGYPLFIFYPPLSYLIGYGPIALGLDPLFSYKAVEFTALLVTPLVFYFFARKLGISEKRALYGTLIFSLVPFTIQNSVVFGRFANIIGYPFFLLALISLVGLLHRFTKPRILLTAVFFSMTLLTHHLSAYILGLIMFVYILGFLLENSSARQKIVNALSVGGSLSLGILISSFWAVPFLLYVRYYGMIGADSSIISGLPFSLGIFGFLVMLSHYLVKKAFPTTNFQYRTLFVWMVLFFILGTTYVPVDFILPFGGEVDLVRFQLYAAIPLAIIIVSIRKYPFSGVRHVVKSMAKVHKAHFWIIILLALNAASGLIVYQTSSTVVAQQIYVKEPPNELIAYLQNSNDYGRILPISVPYWVYLMPHYTNKPLIDGWYPQGSIISPVKQVPWTIDRQTLDAVDDDEIYRFFITHADGLGIKWVLLGNERMYLFEGTSFRPILSGSDYVLMENVNEVFYVTIVPKVTVDWERGKDSIAIEFVASEVDTEVRVKEAFFPGWMAIDNAREVPLSSDAYGFITFKVEKSGYHRVELVFKPYGDIVPESLEELQARVASPE
ncbi:MAG: 6-pyruvoyl-tetrahydropterin synthase-related protein [Candidatus Bathyarchaeia archaeon]